MPENDYNEKIGRTDQGNGPAQPKAGISAYTTPKTSVATSSKRIWHYVLAIVIIIAVVSLVYYSTYHKPAGAITSTVKSTTTIKPVSNSSLNVTTNVSKPVIVKPLYEPQSYLVANAFAENYNFSSPLKYKFNTTFTPSEQPSVCSSALEGIVGYMQNKTMITKPYNLTLLNSSAPMAEYAAIKGINPSNQSQYANIFDSNAGFCSSQFSNSLANSTTIKTQYKYNNISVYLFSMSNISKSGMAVFGSYLGPKPNITVYVGSALYGNYSVKVLSAGFSNSAQSLGLKGFTENLTNSTIAWLEGYLSNHSISK